MEAMETTAALEAIETAMEAIETPMEAIETSMEAIETSMEAAALEAAAMTTATTATAGAGGSGGQRHRTDQAGKYREDLHHGRFLAVPPRLRQSTYV